MALPSLFESVVALPTVYLQNPNLTKQMQKYSKAAAGDTKATKPSLTECLDKCYVLHRSERYEQFLKELKVRKNIRLGALNYRPRVTLSKERDEYILKTSYPEVKDVIVKFRIGETVHRRRPRGFTSTSVFSIIDNKLIEKQEFDNRTVRIERTFTKKNLTITMEVNDVVCQRFYELSTSTHSFGTETSRRSSLWKTSTSESQSGSAPEIESVLEKVLMPEAESEEDVCF